MIQTILPPKDIKYFKSKYRPLNRSKHWALAETYEVARKQAIFANIEVQHQTVR